MIYLIFVQIKAWSLHGTFKKVKQQTWGELWGEVPKSPQPSCTDRLAAWMILPNEELLTFFYHGYRCLSFAWSVKTLTETVWAEGISVSVFTMNEYIETAKSFCWLSNENCGTSSLLLINSFLSVFFFSSLFQGLDVGIFAPQSEELLSWRHRRTVFSCNLSE